MQTEINLGCPLNNRIQVLRKNKDVEKSPESVGSTGGPSFNNSASNSPQASFDSESYSTFPINNSFKLQYISEHAGNTYIIFFIVMSN